MHTSDIHHTQGIKGYHVKSTEYGQDVTVKIHPNGRTGAICPACNHTEVKVRNVGVRRIRALPCGNKKVYFEVPVFRIDCPKCGHYCRAEIAFVIKWTRHTKAVERSVVELRREMSITATAQFLGLDWRTVKDIEKRHLQKKFRKIYLKNVRIIGIDEIYLGKEGYKTIVRDLESGAVLYVGKGKGGDALAGFQRRLRSSKCRIKVVAMDMSAGYSSWVKRVLRKAEIVFDHFHVIQLMNKKLDNLRRATQQKLDEDTRSELKNKRRLFLRNQEDLKDEDRSELEKVKETFEDLSTAHAMKEKLRSIYKTAEYEQDARMLFSDWCEDACNSKIAVLRTMAKTIRSHLEGILAYWKFHRLTNAGMEGFNNKIRWLIRQAYGYHDQEYLELKIYDLPTCKTVKQI